MSEKSIVLAGGCFWGMEKLYRSLRGVVNVTAGYANGRAPELANYAAVCSGITGFREAVRIDYIPEQISLTHLLFVFYAVIDPTVWSRQGMDIGSQYQTGIYWENEDDADTAQAISAREKASRREFYVELTPLKCFYPAEEYHQRHLEKSPDGYCHIAPLKIAALARYPFREADYTRPAAEMLREWLAEQ